LSSRLRQVLHIDLSEKESRIYERPELFDTYLGGAGVASKLLEEECPPRVDPFSPEAPVIFAVGPFTGLLPSMVKTVAMFKSPLTGNLGESHCGGHFATALRFAGFGAVVVKGAADVPSVVLVEDSEVRVEAASSLWGLSPLQVEKSLRSPSQEGMESVASIGIAGENGVYYSGLITDRYHHFGRLGLGAVIGAKKLKAIKVHGTGEIPLERPTEFKDFYEEIHRRVVQTEEMRKYHDLGTPINVMMLNELGALPTKNFTQPRFERAEEISGERFLETLLERKISCPGCPVACIHLGGLRTGFSPQHELGRREAFEELDLVPYNYEPVFALGSNLEIGDAQSVLRLIGQCERVGMDAIMTGSVLAWLTEAVEKGLIPRQEIGDLEPRWGDAATYSKIIENIALAKNQFYKRLALGTSAAAEKYGGKDFAVSIGKNSPAGYATGYGFVVGTLVGARHSHLSNMGYSIDQKAVKSNLSLEQIVEKIADEEDWLYVYYSLIGCYFARGVYDEETIVKALDLIGLSKTGKELRDLGNEIFQRLYRFKVREGFNLAREQIPKRMTEIETPYGKLDPSRLREMVQHYIRIRERQGLRLRRDDEALADLLSPTVER
jgi:aldehyde:ferredoxin oxidoreductase